MKRLFRVFSLIMSLSVTITLLALTMLTSRAYQSGCNRSGGHWYGCETDSGGYAGNDPGDRSGCTVTFLGSSPAAGTGQYYYNCPGTTRDVTCSYYYGECCGGY